MLSTGCGRSWSDRRVRSVTDGLLAAGQQAPARDPLVHRALQDDAATGGATVGVGLVLRGADVAGEADVRMAAAPVLGEVGVADPDQAFARRGACAGRRASRGSRSSRPPGRCGGRGCRRRSSRLYCDHSRSAVCSRNACVCSAIVRLSVVPQTSSTLPRLPSRARHTGTQMHSTKKWSLRMLARMRSASVTRPVGAPRWRKE